MEEVFELHLCLVPVDIEEVIEAVAMDIEGVTEGEEWVFHF